MTFLAGFLLVPYGLRGSFQASELLRRARLPRADCGLMAALAVSLMLGGLGLLLGAPAGVAVIALLIAWRGLAVYNARLMRGRLRLRDVWPASAPDLALACLIALGSR
jgi:hypothetical protein